MLIESYFSDMSELNEIAEKAQKEMREIVERSRRESEEKLEKMQRIAEDLDTRSIQNFSEWREYLHMNIYARIRKIEEKTEAISSQA